MQSPSTRLVALNHWFWTHCSLLVKTSDLFTVNALLEHSLCHAKCVQCTCSPLDYQKWRVSPRMWSILQSVTLTRHCHLLTPKVVFTAQLRSHGLLCSRWQVATAIRLGVSVLTPVMCIGAMPRGELVGWLVAESYYIKLWISLLKEGGWFTDPLQRCPSLYPSCCVSLHVERGGT